MVKSLFGISPQWIIELTKTQRRLGKRAMMMLPWLQMMTRNSNHSSKWSIYANQVSSYHTRILWLTSNSCHPRSTWIRGTLARVTTLTSFLCQKMELWTFGIPDRLTRTLWKRLLTTSSSLQLDLTYTNKMELASWVLVDVFFKPRKPFLHSGLPPTKEILSLLTGVWNQLGEVMTVLKLLSTLKRHTIKKRNTDQPLHLRDLLSIQTYYWQCITSTLQFGK